MNYRKLLKSKVDKTKFDLTPHSKEEAFGDIAACFIRTDFIRYSKGTQFNANEKSELIQKLIDRIEILEKEEGENHA